MQTTSTPANFAQLAHAATSDAILHGPVAAKQHVWQALCEERGIRLNPENLMTAGHVMRAPNSATLAELLAEAAPRVSARIAARMKGMAHA
ncbi:hypothetical protein [Ketogulonicigenium vulgare]|uniref:hypothetical protein n=1 Tax=Ketogulonicigenium vulgare TaxID=92945 RepID=UPI002359E9AA|nr:hypothetical protein [Ketogulonicigenium vulgare]